MNKTLISICIFFTLPMLAVTIHDIYLIYMDVQQGIPDALKLSDLGWIWQEYSFETHEWAKAHISEAIWVSIIVPLLQQTALLVTAVIAVSSYTLLALPKLREFSSKRQEEKARDGREQKFAFNVDSLKKNDIRKKGRGVIKYKNKR